MKKRLLFFVLSCIGFQAFTQVPNSTGYHSQLLQGPCYIFSTIAALESKAIQAGHDNNIDFYEWNLYSTDVLEQRSGNGDNMVKKVIAYAKNYGLNLKNDVISPTTISQLPNTNLLNSTTRGMAHFRNSCGSLKENNYIFNPEGLSGNCVDEDGDSFELDALSDIKYVYNYQDTGFVEVVNPSVLQMQNDLAKGKGLITFFDNWDDDGTSHAVFIHKYNPLTNKWSYKDSWPDNPGNKTTTLDMSKCDKYYYLTGSFDPIVTPTCEVNISGSNTVLGNTTYSIP